MALENPVTTGEARRDTLVELENFVREQRQLPALRVLLTRYGTDVIVTRRRTSSQGTTIVQTALDVYGLSSGLSGNKPHTADTDPGVDISFPARVLINAETYRFADNQFANDFERLYSWTEADILPLDTLEFERLSDGLRYTFQVTSSEVFGQTQTIMRRLLLSPAPENLDQTNLLSGP